MHEAGKFELLNLAGSFPAKRTLLVNGHLPLSKDNPPQKASHQAAHDGTDEVDQIVVQPAPGGGLNHETHERPRKARNAFVCFVLFRAVRVPNRPARPLSRWQGELV
jgi:hypothetical protein